jgi:hypothetical protein
MSALTRLGDRAIGREPGIRPRQFTPFEASWREADRSALASGADDPLERARTRARVAPPGGQPEASASGDAHAIAIGTPPPGAAPRPRMTAQPERSPDPDRRAEATRSTPAFAVPASVAGEPPAAQSLAESPVAARNPQPVTPAHDTRWVPAAAVLPVELPMSPGRPLPIPAAVWRTSAARRERPGLDAGHAASRAVQVTIGRVDVRAVYEPPAARAMPPARRPGAMPLEQYLKERGGR